MPRTDFIKTFCSLSKNTEIPLDFSLWTGLFSIAAVLGRDVWLDMGQYKIFPNQYLILVAGSGRCRKSTSIGLSEDALRAIDPPLNVISQKITPEALIEAMKFERPEGTDSSVVKFHSQTEKSEGIIIADELSMFLNKSSYESGLGSLLIPLWDCKGVVEYRTKGRGIEFLPNVCLSILAGSTVDWIKTAIPEGAIGGGLTSRMLFIYVDQPTDPFAITSFSQDKQDAADRVVDDLQEISTLSGPFSCTKEAWEMYHTLYNEFFESSDLYDDKYLSGYASRRFIHFFKVAMISSVSEGSSLLIEVRHLEAAEWLMKRVEKSLRRVIRLITTSDQGTMIDFVLRLIAQDEQLTRSELVRKVSHRITGAELNVIIETLIHAGQVMTTSNGKATFYRHIKAQGIHESQPNAVPPPGQGPFDIA